MDQNERDELRSSLGVPRTYVRDPNQSLFKSRFKNYIDSLEIDEIWKYAIIGISWPISLFYLTSTIVSAIVFEVIFILLIIFQGWPIYFFAAFCAFAGAITHEEFKTYNRFIRYGFWGTCVSVMIYILYPFDVRAHEKNIKATSTHITNVIFPTFEKSSESPQIFIDSSFAKSRDDFYSDFTVKSAFYAEFSETCEVALIAASEGAGKLIWKQTFDKIEFVLSNGEVIPFSDCEDFNQEKEGELTAKFEPTWAKSKSIDAWGRVDFAGEEFSDAKAPSGVVVEVLFAELDTPDDFKVVSSFVLRSDWYGEVEVPIDRPVFAKLQMKAQSGLPETESQAFRVEPDGR